MTNKKILDYFKQLFPQYADQMTGWSPNGKNTIKIRLNGRQDFMFTYISKNNWRFETAGSYSK